MMKYLIVIAVKLTVTFSVFSQPFLFIMDDFTDSAAHIDLSEKIIRKGLDTTSSAFTLSDITDEDELSFKSIHLSDIGVGKGGYNFDKEDFMTHTCIDYEFPKTINRSSGDTIWIEFDAMFSEIDGSGESNRLVVFLLHDYPENGPNRGDFRQTTEHKFGRPAYNVRILPGSHGMFMAYGGGHDPLGSFEISNNMWLPGFSSAAGSGSTIGQGQPYPENSWNEVDEGTSTTSTSLWMHYTMELTPDDLQVFIRKSGTTPASNQRLLFMKMPENGNLSTINDAHQSSVTALPPNYHWFQYLEALRIYWRSANENANVYLANVKASKSGIPITPYVEFASEPIRTNENAGSINVMVYAHNVDTQQIQAYVSLISGNPSLIDNFSSQTLSFGTEDDSIQAVALNIIPDDDDINDTLVFKIQNVTGDRLAITGKMDTITLIIEDNVTSTYSPLAGDLNIYPTPANDFLHVQYINEVTANLIIYSITGDKIIEIKDFDFSPISVTGLNSGIYILTLQLKDAIVSRRINIVK